MSHISNHFSVREHDLYRNELHMKTDVGLLLEIDNLESSPTMQRSRQDERGSLMPTDGACGVY